MGQVKQAIVEAGEGDTQLGLKLLAPVRLLKNDFALHILALEREGRGKEELSVFLGRGRAKKGMFEGDLVAGELEIGQISGLINEVKPASEIVSEILTEYRQALSEQSNEKFNF